MSTIRKNTLIVLVGATGVGKTELALKIAERTGCSILSADSRQMYRKLKIGTAMPSNEDRLAVNHYFIENLNVDEYYNASTFETEVLSVLDSLYHKNPIQLLCGGSMMYIDAVTKGIDNIPDIDPEVRNILKQRWEQEGIDSLRLQLKSLDPTFYNNTDIKNPKRIIHGLEVCLTTGLPYSSFLTQRKKDRNFNIIKIGLEREREELYNRINSRVLQMIELGLVEEAKLFLPHRNLNALNTVGYKEIFEYLDGNYSQERAIELIQRNTRHYAKKQITWFKKDPEIKWFHPQEWDNIRQYLNI